jgi:hypothetical protein
MPIIMKNTAGNCQKPPKTFKITIKIVDDKAKNKQTAKPRTLTYQQIFNRVWRHIIKQGGPAMDGNTCAYRAKNGRKCGIGALIPDDVYEKRIEGMGVNDLEGLFLKKCRLPATDNDLFFLGEIQDCHDKTCDYHDFIDAFKKEMRRVAKKYKLTVPKKQAKQKKR